MVNHLPTAFFFLVLLVRLVTSQNEYLARVDRLGDAIVLNCTDGDVLPAGASVQYWIEPRSFEILYPGNSANEMEVSSDGLSLLIPEVTEHHLGDYFCLLMKDGEPVYSRTTLYLYLPEFMEVYRSNLIIGLTAAGIFLVVSTAGCCLYVLKYEPHPDDDDDTATLNLYENGGYLSSSMQDLDKKKSYQLDTQF